MADQESLLDVPARRIPPPSHLSDEARAQLALGTLSNPAWPESGDVLHRALRRADIEAELHVFDAATHVMFMSGPEAADRNREIRRFVDRCWRRTSATT